MTATLESLLDVAEAIVKERLARLNVAAKGDYEGHPFRGNQYSGGHVSMDEALGDAALDMQIYSDISKSPNKKAIGAAVARHIKATSGNDVSDAEGLEFARSVQLYAGNAENYQKIRTGKMPETSKNIDKLISKSAPFEGEIYRGMSFDDESFVSQLTPGASLNTGGISSWSSDKKHSNTFASRKKIGVMLSVKNKSGASITFLSKDQREQEVLSPSQARYRVKSVSKKQQGNKTIYNVKLEEE